MDQEDPYEREDSPEEGLQLIVFRLDREWYGVEISKVIRVLKAGKITYLPSCPGHIAGIVNFRGSILSVTDLKTIFCLPHAELTEKSRIIVVESEVLETGLLVDEVVETVEVPIRKIEPTLSTLPADGAKYIKGQCGVAEKLVAVLNVEKVLEKRA